MIVTISASSALRDGASYADIIIEGAGFRGP